MKNNLLQSTKAGALALAATALLLPGATLEAQIFLTNSDSISEYTTSGVLVKAKLVKGLDGAEGIVVSGGDLFVVNGKSGTIGEYTTSGATINASLVSGLSSPTAIAVSGGDLFVETSTTDKKVTSYQISEYTTSGAPVGSAFGIPNGEPGVAVSGPYLYVASYTPLLNLYATTDWGGAILQYFPNGAELSSIHTPNYSPTGVAVDSGGDVFFTAASAGGIIGEINANSAVAVTLVSGLGPQSTYGPTGIAVSGGDLFVSDGATISEYTTSGATVDASLVTGLSSTGYLAVETGVADPTNVQAVPEPTTTTLIGVALVGFCAAVRPRKRAKA
jgi:hypothetical protein